MASKQSPRTNNFGAHLEEAPSSQETSKSSTPGQILATHKDQGNDFAEPHLGSNLAHPKKKGGFVITSVKDNVDGDESADELDESHASYSDVSYSRTTDVDRDQESSVSEDTISMTTSVQDIAQLHTANPAIRNMDYIPSYIGGTTAHDFSPRMNDISLPLDAVETPFQNSASDLMASGQAFTGMSADFSPDMTIHRSDITDINSTKQIGAFAAPTFTTSTHLDKVTAANTVSQTAASSLLQQQTVVASFTKNAVISSCAVTSASAVPTSSANNSKPAAVPGAAPTKCGASRVYKVVKREMTQPLKQLRGRWTCNDYLDTLVPKVGFVAHSASESRINFHDPLHHHSSVALPMSMSSTSVPASAFTLPHSDSASSVQRDAHPPAAMTTQHSSSGSSVNHEIDSRKLFKSYKTLEYTDDTFRQSLFGDDGLPLDIGADPEFLRNMMRSSGDLTVTSETDDESTTSRNIKIDNKIEAAMDLVKKHLMWAVRDEVDELKEKIAELQEDIGRAKFENEALRGILTPEQLAYIQPNLARALKSTHFPSSLQGPHIQSTWHPQISQAQPGVTLHPAQPAVLDVEVPTQPHAFSHQLSGLQPTGHMQAAAINTQHPQSFSAINQAINQSRSSNVHMQSHLPSPTTTLPPISYAQKQQAMPSAQPPILHQIPLPQQPIVQQQQQAQIGLPPSYQQTQQLSLLQALSQQQPSLNPQQLQLLCQQGYQNQMPMHQGQSGYPPLVVQQSTTQVQQGLAAYQHKNVTYAQGSQPTLPQSMYLAQGNIPMHTVHNQPQFVASHSHQPLQTSSTVTSPTSLLTPMFDPANPSYQSMLPPHSFAPTLSHSHRPLSSVATPVLPMEQR